MPRSVLLRPGEQKREGVREQPFTASRWAASSLARPEDLLWFTQARFGLFVHFGVSSLKGVELGWGRHTHIAPDTREGSVPDDVYDSLYTQFRLERFDARQWVSMARAAGMKYLVVITKHHDGFHMWDTAYSDYKITRAPFGRDYVREVVAACQVAGMPVGLYYSQRDWYHPDYDPLGQFPGRDHARYVRYMHDTVRELLTSYGKIDILWLDAAWWGGMFVEENWDSEALYRMARQLQPGIIINNRASIPGDFDTPEQRVGAFQNHRPWESCITIGSGWAWRPDDQTKSLKTCVSLLVQVAVGDGNLLLNLGPRPDGSFEPEQVGRLEAMGQWLATAGESIYGTRGGPFPPNTWGGSTHRGRRVYVHVLDWRGQDAIALPPLSQRILNARLVGGGGVRELRQTDEGIRIAVDERDHDKVDTIIVLDLDRPVSLESLPTTSGL